MNYWNIKPILGQMNSQGVVVIFNYLYSKNLILKVSKIINNEKICLNNVSKIENYGNIVFTKNFNNKKYQRFFIPLEEEGEYYQMNFINKFFGIVHSSKFLFLNEPNSFLIVSCDNYDAKLNKKNSLWTKMYNEIDKGDQLLLHIGDQVYMDKIISKEIKHIYNGELKKAKNLALSRYSKTWMPQSQLLSTIPNLMIMDDHEIINNYENIIKNNKININDNDDEEFFNKKYNMSKYLTKIVDIHTKFYMKYQISLHFSIPEDISWAKYYNKTDTLLICMDRTYTYFNLNYIDYIIENNPSKNLLFCYSGFPFIQPKNRKSKLYSFLFSDSKFMKKEIALGFYNILFKWKNVRDMNIVLAGGDAHFGMYGKIIEIKTGFHIDVICSSPITNQPTPDRFLLSKCYKGKNKISEHYNMNIIKSKASRCYGKIDFSNNLNLIEMTFSNKNLPNSLLNYFNSLYKSKKSINKFNKKMN